MIINKIDLRILNENNHKCIMFWCIPIPSDNEFKWDIEIIESDGYDSSNWLIILYKIKRLWEVDIDKCKNSSRSLPRGVLYNNSLYHGNNVPPDIGLNNIAEKMHCKLNKTTKSVYDKRFGIEKKDLDNLQDVLGINLNLQYTE